LDFYINTYNTRDEAMARAYLGGHYTLEQVGRHFGVSYATVSRAVKALESRSTR
jgi:transposase